MNADEIVRRLHGRWSGDQALAHCPVEGHGKRRGDLSPSLSIAIGEGGRVLIHCFAGCRVEDIFAALRSTDFSSRTRTDPRDIVGPGPRYSASAASALWANARAVKGTAGEAYLRSRGLPSESDALRFLPATRHPNHYGTGLTALLAAVRGPDNLVSAVQRTFLTKDGVKASIDPVRMTLGGLGRGAVRLTPADTTLGLAEGIETALSATELFKVPVWAACGARLARIELPPGVRRVLLFADYDAPGAVAAEAARKRFVGEGRAVDVLRPQREGWDWNDELLASRGARDAC